MKKIFYSLMVAVFAAFTFTSCEDVPMPYEQPGTGGGSGIVIEPTGSGTADDPFNVAAAIAKCQEVGTTGTTDFYYVMGKIKSVDVSGVAQYGNVNIDMIDEGGKNVFKAFQILYIDKAKFTDATASALIEGDVIVVKGQLVNYSGNTPETIGKGSAYIVSINGSAIQPESTSEPKGTGTSADPYNVAKAIQVAAALEKSSTSASYLSNEVYVKGKICSITDTELSSYGNITYYISDDGTTAGQLEVYRGLSIDGAKFKTINDIKVGDEVVVKGKLQNWLGTYEFTQGSSLVSINGNGGGTQPDTPGEATEITCAKAVEICNALEDKVETTELYTVTGYITDTDGKISRDQQVFWMADTKDGRKMFEAYWANIPDPTKALPVGTKVKMTGKLMRYGTTPEMKNGNVVVLEMGDGSSTGGNDNTGGNTGSSEGLSISGTTVTLTAAGVTAGTTTTSLDLSTLGYENAADVTTVNFPDGATLTFDKNTNKNAPKYYTATKGVRVYSDNILTFTGASNIAVITMECDVYNGVNQVGSKVATISFSGKTAVYTNVNDGANTQLRVKTITITYAN